MKRERTVQRVFVDPFRRRAVKTKITDSVRRASGGAVGRGDVKDTHLTGKGAPWSAAHDGGKKK